MLVDDYVKSVVSAEMPGGWTTAAYQAQAIAARSYGLFKRAAAVTAGNAWHICDSTSCQVYNGYTGRDLARVQGGDGDLAAVPDVRRCADLRRVQLRRRRLDADGGKPYLVAKADPYDGVVTGTANWGHAWTKDVSASAIQAAYPSIGSIERIVVTDRVGSGEWGGRVITARLEGSKADADGERHRAAQRPGPEERVVQGRPCGPGTAPRRDPHSAAGPDRTAAQRRTQPADDCR